MRKGSVGWGGILVALGGYQIYKTVKEEEKSTSAVQHYLDETKSCLDGLNELEKGTAKECKGVNKDLEKLDERVSKIDKAITKLTGLATEDQDIKGEISELEELAQKAKALNRAQEKNLKESEKLCEECEFQTHLAYTTLEANEEKLKTLSQQEGEVIPMEVAKEWSNRTLGAGVALVISQTKFSECKKSMQEAQSLHDQIGNLYEEIITRKDNIVNKMVEKLEEDG